MNKLNDWLLDNSVKGIEFLEDQIHINFVDGSNLYLYNPVAISRNDSIVGCKVLQVILSNESLKILFETGLELKMSLKDKDYRGPEAFSFRSSNGEIIVL
jgi:hypothetical protein